MLSWAKPWWFRTQGSFGSFRPGLGGLVGLCQLTWSSVSSRLGSQVWIHISPKSHGWKRVNSSDFVSIDHLRTVQNGLYMMKCDDLSTCWYQMKGRYIDIEGYWNARLKHILLTSLDPWHLGSLEGKLPCCRLGNSWCEVCTWDELMNAFHPGCFCNHKPQAVSTLQVGDP